MRRSDGVLAVAGALLVVLAVGFAPSWIPAPLREYVLGPALDFWYVGVAATVATFVLGRRSAWPGLARLLAILGVAWVAFVVGYYVLLVLVFVLFRPMV
jgi:hypothetical protein